MKNYFMLCLMLITLISYSQNDNLIVTISGKSNGFITLDELLKDSLKVNDVNCKIISFVISGVVDGLIEVQRSFSNKFEENQKQFITKLLPGSKIYFQEIKIKNQDGEVKNGNYFFLTIDGINADFFRKKNELISVRENIILKPELLVYSDFNTKESTSQYTIKSFTLNSTQPDFYFEFNSNSSKLSKQMIDFIITANYGITFKDIIAIDKLNNEIKLKQITKEFDDDFIYRKKSDLINNKKMDFISSKCNLKILSFELNGLKSKNDEFTHDMRELFKKSNIGDNFFFTINVVNSENKQFDIYISLMVKD